MESIVTFYIITILIVTATISLILYLIYWIFKKFKRKNIGVSLACILATIILLIILSPLYEDYLFFKCNAIGLLAEHQIYLTDKFNIVSNKTYYFDSYHEFKICISAHDKKALIENLTKAPIYKGLVKQDFVFTKNFPKYSDKNLVFITSYQDSLNYKYECYKPNTMGHSPIRDIITLPKLGNLLVYERFNE